MWNALLFVSEREDRQFQPESSASCEIPWQHFNKGIYSSIEVYALPLGSDGLQPNIDVRIKAYALHRKLPARFRGCFLCASRRTSRHSARDAPRAQDALGRLKSC